MTLDSFVLIRCRKPTVTFTGDDGGNVKFHNPLYAVVAATAEQQQQPNEDLAGSQQKQSFGGDVPNSPPGYREMEFPHSNYFQTLDNSSHA
jgi:hypothetical protein